MKQHTQLRILAAIIVFAVVAPLEWLIHMPLWLIFGAQPVLFLIVFAIEEGRAGKSAKAQRNRVTKRGTLH